MRERSDSIRHVGGVRGPASSVRSILRRTKRSLRMSATNRVGVVFCDAGTIRRINRTYRNHNQPTDVLSFSYRDQRVGTSDIIGEIFICIPVARKQAKRFKHSFEDEVCLLAVHGLLHIMGFNHHTKEQARKMRKREDTILQRPISRSEGWTASTRVSKSL